MSGKVPGDKGLGAAMKRAFLWHWHILGLASVVAFAMMNGQFGEWFPFLAAAEIGYLGLLGMNPRFQAVLRGKEILENAPEPKQSQAEKLVQMIAFLSPEDRARFNHLRGRCSELMDLRRSMAAKEGESGEAFRFESLDRMIWLFLKLLHQRSGLDRFLATAKRGEMEKELAIAQEQINRSIEKDKELGVTESRLTQSVSERLKTIQDRIHNYNKASESLELADSEIDKTEQQITHLCEVGMTMRDPAGLVSQIDGISASLLASDQIFADSELSSLYETESVPQFVSGRTTRKNAVAE